MEAFTIEEQLAATLAMIQQMRNQLLQATILDRMMTRKKLANLLTTNEMNMDGQNRASISQLKHSLEHLDQIYKQIVDEQEKGDLIPTTA